MSEGIPIDRDLAEVHYQWLMTNWRHHAAYAWECYQAEGRGLLLVDMGEAKPFAGRAFGWLKAHCGYVPDAVQRESGGWRDPVIENAVRTYDPEKQIVVLFTRTDGGLAMRIFERPDDLPPREASRQGYAKGRTDSSLN